MTTEFESKVAREFEACYKLIRELQEQVEALTETVDDQAETIRGLEVETQQNSEAINNLQSEQDDYRCELDEIGAEIDCHVQHDRNP
jgi:uncharacterized coiled-coil DUF342 family protein